MLYFIVSAAMCIVDLIFLILFSPDLFWFHILLHLCPWKKLCLISFLKHCFFVHCFPVASFLTIFLHLQGFDFFVLFQEIVSIYPVLSPPNLTPAQSNRVCNALALLQVRWLCSIKLCSVFYCDVHFVLVNNFITWLPYSCSFGLLSILINYSKNCRGT